MAFLPDPLPERLWNMVHFEPRRVLTIGVKEVDTDSAGLKIVPVKAVVIAIGDSDNFEKEVFVIDKGFAKVLAQRLEEFIQVCTW